MQKRPLTPTYLFFYLLFWPDTWRILIGLIIAGLLTPRLLSSDRVIFELIMLFFMLAAIGYTVSAKPARWITERLRKVILKNRGS